MLHTLFDTVSDLQIFVTVARVPSESDVNFSITKSENKLAEHRRRVTN